MYFARATFEIGILMDHTPEAFKENGPKSVYTYDIIQCCCRIIKYYLL